MPSPSAHADAPLARLPTALAACASGWGVMAGELGLLRLVTPYLGASLPVWACVIALVLSALALGAALGGRLSRRRAAGPALVLLLATAGLLLALAPAPLSRLLGWLIDSRGVGFVGAALGLGLAAGTPLLLAAAATPLLVQARVHGLLGRRSDSPVVEPHAGAPGAAAGLVTASATVGSLLGTLLPAFVTLPLLGTTRTFLLAAAPLLLVALWLHHLSSREPGTATGALGVALILVGGALGPPAVVPQRPGTIATAESTHHHIAVVRRPEGHRVLLLDAGYAEQSYYDPAGQQFYGPWPVMAAAPLLLRPDSNRPSPQVLLVGLGGGTAALQLVTAFPQARVIGVELDAAVLRLARQHMGLDHPRIRPVVADGRAALRRQADRSLDAVVMDAAHRLMVPFHLVTLEAFRLARRKLRPGGVVVLNLARLAGDTRLTDGIARTGRRVFAHAYRLLVAGGTNALLLLTDHPLDPRDLQRRAAGLRPPGFGRYVSSQLAGVAPWRARSPATAPFTDDRAPVEVLVLSMLWRHVMGSP